MLVTKCSCSVPWGAVPHETFSLVTPVNFPYYTTPPVLGNLACFTSQLWMSSHHIIRKLIPLLYTARAQQGNFKYIRILLGGEQFSKGGDWRVINLPFAIAVHTRGITTPHMYVVLHFRDIESQVFTWLCDVSLSYKLLLHSALYMFHSSLQEFAGR